ncbi:MAG TPA: uroporphyrinogen decarboxylase family protein [Armatimonadota bacterium]
MNTPMSTILLDAYAHPERKAFYYTCLGRDTTGSDRLNTMPYWHWNPQPSIALPEGAPSGGTQSIPLAFGCHPIYTTEGREWCEPLIHDPAQVRDIDIPDIHVGRLGKKLEYLAQVRALLPAGYTTFIWDPLAPLSVAELMWDESFYTALLEHPQAVHDLLEKITTFTIRYIQALHATVGPEHVNPTACPPLWARCPGYYISDDTMSLLSPEMHLEFSIPYINRITESCGPVCYHSCTWRQRYFENLHQLKNVLVFNWNPGNSDDPAIIMDEFAGQAILAPHIVHKMHQDNDVLKWNPNFPDEYEFVKYFLDHQPEHGAVFLWFSNIVENGPVMDRIYDLLHANGCTPQAQGVG